MEFLYPGFLYALIALAIPILVHLFNFRRFKKIEFTNVRFLKEIKHQTQNQNKLKHFLVLAMRMLALAALVFAFAQPFIPLEDQVTKVGKRQVSVFVDNSFSMQGESESGELLEVGKNKAIDIVQAHEVDDRFQLLTQDFKSEHQHFITSETFANWATRTEYSPRTNQLSKIVERQNDQLLRDSESDRLSAYIISDFQKSQFNFEDLPVDSTITYSLVHIERAYPANIFIDTVWFDSPVRTIGNSEKLNIRIVNTGANPISDIPVKLIINGEQKAIGSIGAGAETAVDTALHFVHSTPGIKETRVHVDDHPVTYDDEYYFSYAVYNQIDVLVLVNGGESSPKGIRSVFKSDSLIAYRESAYNQIDYSKLNQQDLVILNELHEIPTGLASELATFCQNGGTVLVNPSAQLDLSSYNGFLAQLNGDAMREVRSGEFQVREINVEHPIFEGVFEKIPKNVALPTSGAYNPLSQNTRSRSNTILEFGNGDPFLTSYQKGGGTAYVLTTPLSQPENSLSRNALFVPIMLRIAELSKSNTPLIEKIGKSLFSLNLPNEFVQTDESVVHLINESKSVDVIPGFQFREGKVQIDASQGIEEAGNYQVRINDDWIGSVGMNYDRSESDLASFNADEIAEELEKHGLGKIRIFNGLADDFKNEINTASTEKELWKICLILALSFLLIESLILRFWK